MTQKQFVRFISGDVNLTDDLVLHGNENITILVGVTGLWMQPFDIVRDRVSTIPGSTLRNVVVKERPITIPILVQADSPGGVEDILDLINRHMHPKHSGEGILEWTTMSGRTKRMNVIYTGGLSGSDGSDAMDVNLAKRTISFLAMDPFWYETETVDIDYSISGAISAFLTDPFFPLQITSSTVLSSPTISILTDEETWPEFIITGPGENIVLKNTTTSKFISLTNNGGLTLGIGEQIRICTAPNNRLVRYYPDTDVNLFKYLSFDSDFWSLIPGDNLLSFQMDDAVAGSIINLIYTPASSGR